jgi:NitT/TauT family transport system substrate-binding protein
MIRPLFLRGVALAAAAPAVPLAARADDGAVLRIASAADDDVTPVLYADRAGWFRDAGMNVHVDRLNNGTAVAAAVAGGAIDIGKVSMLAMILAHARGVPLTIIAACSLSTPAINNSGLLVPNDSPIRVARDLTGKIVSVGALNDMQALSTQTWIDKNGGNSKAVSFVEEPGPAVGVALDTNRIAAGTAVNPTLMQLLATGKYRSIGRPIQSISNRLMISAWVSSIDWATKNASAARTFSQIVLRAGAYANTHHDQTADLIAAFSGIEPATVRTMARAAFADKLEASTIQPLIDVAAKYGTIKQRFPATEMFSPSAAGTTALRSAAPPDDLRA